MDPKIKEDYMDIDEFLTARGLCNGLAFPESDYTDDDFNSIPDNAEFDGNLGQLLSEQLPTAISEFTDEGRGSSMVPSPGSQVSSDEGRGGSIASDSIVSGQSSGSEYTEGRRRRKRNTVGQKNPTKRTRSHRSKSSGASKTNNNGYQVATAVDINGVKYSYSIEAGVKHKRQKTSVPGELKDEKYWERRLKNNVAAKRSRDLKRQKEMTVASRAALLEIENEKLRNEVQMLKKRLETLSEELDESENQ